MPDGPERVEDERVWELEFALSADDFVCFAEHLASTGTFQRAQMEHLRRLSLAVIAVGFALFALLERDVFSTILMSVPLGTFALVLWFAWPSRYRTLAGRQARQLASAKSGALLGPKRYRIDAGSVAFSGVHSGGYVLWTGVTRVTSDEASVYLHIAETTAHIIPRRAFSSGAEAESFARQAEKWRAGVTDPTAPSVS